MIPGETMRAIRQRCALGFMDHVACVRLGGEHAFDALEALCPAPLYVRDGQMLHSLLLGPDGTPLVDLYVCRDDEELLLLAEGMPGEALVAHLRDAVPAGLRPELRDLGATHRLLSLGGPWAWELMSELVGPGVVGLPYLTFYHEDGFTCFRAGKTGEYGYDLLVPREGVEALVARMEDVGRPFDLGTVDLDALDQCALENWFFNIRREGRCGATPLELQLQWRVAYDRDYPGAAALRALRARGPAQRLTCLLAAGQVDAGDPVRDGERIIGRVVNAGHSPLRGDWVALALLDRDLAHAGLAGFTVSRDGAEVAVRTTTPPVIDNLSLFVQPQRHSYRTRAEHRLPGLE